MSPPQKDSGKSKEKEGRGMEGGALKRNFMELNWNPRGVGDQTAVVCFSVFTQYSLKTYHASHREPKSTI